MAELIVDVLGNTEPGTTKAGGPSKASYPLGDGVADQVKDASAELLDKHPLYPGLGRAGLIVDHRLSTLCARS